MLFDVGRASGTKLCRLLCMEYELGGDRAVIIVSALVAILSSQQKQFVNLTTFFSYLRFNTNNSVYL